MTRPEIKAGMDTCFPVKLLDKDPFVAKSADQTAGRLSEECPVPTMPTHLCLLVMANVLRPAAARKGGADILSWQETIN